ncbi:MAG: hypothetical protein GX786_02815 [Clostridiales bacterium]|nr:hypothetical protein [Clostridiales bacterium]
MSVFCEGQMVGYVFLLVYIASGIKIVQWLLPGFRPITRYWLGASVGFVLAMWLPVLVAFFTTFNYLANGLSLMILLGITLGSYFAREKKSLKPFDENEKKLAIIMGILIIPLTIFSGYLQYTHTIMPRGDGSLWVGQSTFGDLSMHLSFVTSFKNASFPPEYSIYPGTRLAYPFLVDTLSTSLYMMGTGLQNSLIVPGTGMMFLCYVGFFLLAKEMTQNKKAAILAFALFFFNGGLGFIYDFDQSGGALKERLNHILTGFYTTPVNQPEKYNLVWSNVIADMMIPQRTTLAGWMTLLPCMYLLCDVFSPKKREKRQKFGLIERESHWRRIVVLSFLAGAMPMIHTHSFLSLALMTLGFMLYTLVSGKKEERKKDFFLFALFGGITLILSMPQLVVWTFQQSLGNESFLQFHFNWKNNMAVGGEIALRDQYLWFYIKNIGLPVFFLIAALFEKKKNTRFLALGAFSIFVFAELIQFQPNPYDNNKLLYVWYMLCAMIVGDYLVTLYEKLEGLGGRKILAAVTGVALFLSGGLSLLRESVSSYEAYSKEEVALAKYVEEQTDPEAVFLTGGQHLNPIASLAGRTIVCGADNWLHFHGIDTTQRSEEVRAFYEEPIKNQGIIEKYDIRYILVSSYEQDDYVVDSQALQTAYKVIYQGNGMTLYEVGDNEG